MIQTPSVGFFFFFSFLNSQLRFHIIPKLSVVENGIFSSVLIWIWSEWHKNAGCCCCFSPFLAIAFQSGSFQTMNVKQVIAQKYLWTFFFFFLLSDKKWTFTLKIRCFVWQFVSSFMFYWFNGTQNLCPVRWFWYYAFCVGRYVFCILLARHQAELVAKKGYRSTVKKRRKKICCMI